MFDDDEEDVFVEDVEDGAENDEDIVPSGKGPVRSKRMIVDSSDED